MKVFICWLISIFTDIVGSLVFIFLLGGGYQIIQRSMHELHVDGYYTFEFSATVAVVLSILTAFYAAINYELTLSWAVLRWTSPLNVFSGRISHFFLTLFFSYVAWTATLFISISYIFPQARFKWIVPFIKGISENLYNYIFT